MAENWDFYLCNVNDAVASIAIDLEATEPDPHRPWLLAIRLELKAPDEHGLSTADEAPALSEFEDALVAAMGLEGAFQVARMTRAGFREFFFYGEEDEPLAELLDDIVPDNDYRVGWRTEEDPEWSRFLEFLYPDAQTQQWMMDRRVCDGLSQYGDVASIVRPVDHDAVFEDEAAADNFATAATALGFTAERSGCGVHLVRADPVELDHIHAVAWSLFELAAAQGGHYDGWGTGIVSAEEEG